MRVFLNFLWFISGGILMGLGWYIIGLIMFLSVFLIPWGRSCFFLGKMSFFPFGKELISRKDFYNKDDLGTGGLGTIGNLIWLPFGISLCIGHLAAAFLNAIFIIGIPFAFQHLKLAGASLLPVGKMVVTKEEYQVAMRKNAEDKVSSVRTKKNQNELVNNT